MKATRSELARIAKETALYPFHGTVDGEETNLAPLIAHFPKWNVVEADEKWCAAFVYHCVLLAGFEIPYSPNECETCSLAGCGGWEEFAKGDERIGYFLRDERFSPEAGDIVLFDKVFSGVEHDHIGIVLDVSDTKIKTAEGNVNNRSEIMTRNRDEHIRSFIRLPDGYKYKDKK